MRGERGTRSHPPRAGAHCGPRVSGAALLSCLPEIPDLGARLTLHRVSWSPAFFPSPHGPPLGYPKATEPLLCPLGCRSRPHCCLREWRPGPRLRPRL